MSLVYSKFRYKLEIAGLEAAKGFTEVTGFDLTIDPVEYREGDYVAQTPIKIPAMKKYGNITLKKGVSADSKVLYDWIQKGVNGDVERHTVTITLYDEAMKDLASWQVINAWPTKYTATDFNATSNDIAIETLELVHEGMTRTK